MALPILEAELVVVLAAVLVVEGVGHQARVRHSMVAFRLCSRAMSIIRWCIVSRSLFLCCFLRSSARLLLMYLSAHSSSGMSSPHVFSVWLLRMCLRAVLVLSL